MEIYKLNYEGYYMWYHMNVSRYFLAKRHEAVYIGKVSNYEYRFLDSNKNYSGIGVGHIPSEFLTKV